jgi:hypothetical protein
MNIKTVELLLKSATPKQIEQSLQLALTGEDCEGYHTWKEKYEAVRKAFANEDWGNPNLVFMLSRAEISEKFLLLFK